MLDPRVGVSIRGMLPQPFGEQPNVSTRPLRRHCDRQPIHPTATVATAPPKLGRMPQVVPAGIAAQAQSNANAICDVWRLIAGTPGPSTPPVPASSGHT